MHGYKEGRMEIVLFHIRTRPDINEQEYQRAFERMLKLVSRSPALSGSRVSRGRTAAS